MEDADHCANALANLNIRWADMSESTFSDVAAYKADYFTLLKYAYSNILKNSPPKTESFQIKILIFFIFLLKAYIVGIRQICLAEAVLTSTHNICF